MIIKNLWEELLYDIKWFKNHKNTSWQSEESLQLYIGLLCLSILTPIVGIFDLLLLPLEIGYYFFKKWTNQD